MKSYNNLYCVCYSVITITMTLWYLYECQRYSLLYNYLCAALAKLSYNSMLVTCKSVSENINVTFQSKVIT